LHQFCAVSWLRKNYQHPARYDSSEIADGLCCNSEAMDTSPSIQPAHSDLIWVLDGTSTIERGLPSPLRIRYELEYFQSPETLRTALIASPVRHAVPGLIITTAGINDQQIPGFLFDPSFILPPVIIVSECNDFQMISRYLELGVADYFLQPVDSNLLLAKVEALFRSGRKIPPSVKSGLLFDISTHSVRNEKGASVKVTQKEYQILSVLDKTFPKGLSPLELRRQIWGQVSVGSKSLDVHLFKLRRKLNTIGLNIQYLQKETYVLVKIIGS
jgi:hypothetical protein